MAEFFEFWHQEKERERGDYESRSHIFAHLSYECVYAIRMCILVTILNDATIQMSKNI